MFRQALIICRAPKSNEV